MDNFSKNKKYLKIQKAIQNILNGICDEIIIENVITDLEEYGGSNDIV